MKTPQKQPVTPDLIEEAARELFGKTYAELGQGSQSAVMLEAEGRANRASGTPDYHDEPKPAAVAAHTPGPWTISDALPAGRYSLRDARGLLVATLPNHEESALRQSENQSNARLIAAAPELLAACHEAFSETCSDNRNQDLIDLLDAAIAKAEGRA